MILTEFRFVELPFISFLHLQPSSVVHSRKLDLNSVLFFGNGVQYIVYRTEQGITEFYWVGWVLSRRRPISDRRTISSWRHRDEPPKTRTNARVALVRLFLFPFFKQNKPTCISNSFVSGSFGHLLFECFSGNQFFYFITQRRIVDDGWITLIGLQRKFHCSLLFFLAWNRTVEGDERFCLDWIWFLARVFFVWLFIFPLKKQTNLHFELFRLKII